MNMYHLHTTAFNVLCVHDTQMFTVKLPTTAFGLCLQDTHAPCETDIGECV